MVHRIVAETFINNPNNYKYVNHKDENPSNNCVTNLEWCTQKYNINYGTGNQKRSEAEKLGALWCLFCANEQQDVRA